MLPPDHPARAVVAFAARLDLSPLLNAVRSREGTRGHLDIDLAILVTPRLYATIDGVDSAREPERLRELNLPYQWLCGGVGVNYHTLADARLNCDAWLNTTLTASRAEAGELACGRRILQSRGGDESGDSGGNSPGFQSRDEHQPPGDYAHYAKCRPGFGQNGTCQRYFRGAIQLQHIGDELRTVGGDQCGGR